MGCQTCVSFDVIDMVAAKAATCSTMQWVPDKNGWLDLRRENNQFISLASIKVDASWGDGIGQSVRLGHRGFSVVDWNTRFYPSLEEAKAALELQVVTAILEGKL